MKVIHVPYWGSSNPYQDKLINHLNKLGVVAIQKTTYKDMFAAVNCRDSDIDVVHFHWLPRASPNLLSLIRTFLFFIRLKKLSRTSIRLVVTIHNIIPHESEIEWMDLRICRKVAVAADALIVHGKSAIPQVVKAWKVHDQSKIHVIAHANYIDEYKNNISQQTARSALGLDENKKTLLFFGGIRNYKGIFDLVDAYKKLAQPEVQMVIAGKPVSNELKKSLDEAVAGTDIIFHCCRVEDDDVQKYFNASDAVIFPYKKMLTSGSVVLAMSFARACVVPKAGCMPDILDQKGAFFFNANDPDSLLDALQSICKSSNLRAMGDYNFSVAKQWSWSNIAVQTYQVYNSKSFAAMV